MSILRFLGLGPKAATGENVAGDTATVRRIITQLEALDPERARYIASFAYILSRVANADFEISAAETRRMEELVERYGNLPADQAVLVVQIAKTQSRLFGATEDFLVTREFKRISTPAQRRELLHCLFAVAAADDSISAAEEAQVRQIANELELSHADFVATRAAYAAQREVLRGLPRSRGT